MNRKWIRVTFLLAAFCLTLVAAAPDASASCPITLRCTTEGDVTVRQVGCCTLAFGPMIKTQLYVCHNGCFQASGSPQCTVDPCV